MAGLESHRNHAYLEIIYGKGMGFGRDQPLNPFGPGGSSRPGRAPSLFWNRRFIKEEEEMDVSDGFVGAFGNTPLIHIGSAHVCTYVTNAHFVCRLLLEKKHPNHDIT